MKRRYTSEQEILKAIEHCHIRAKASLVQADWHEAEAKRLFKLAYEKEIEYNNKGAKRDVFRNEFQEVWQLQDHGKTELSLMEACRKRARNLVEKKATKLGNKLSEFTTVQMTLFPALDHCQSDGLQLHTSGGAGKFMAPVKMRNVAASESQRTVPR